MVINQMPFNLMGINFNRDWCAAGARGFYGEGYPFHKYLEVLGIHPDFTGSSLVTKTVTLEPRLGNLPLKRCVKVNFRKAAVLNAVGLPNPGMVESLKRGQWQTRLDPFIISLTSVKKHYPSRLADFQTMATLLRSEWHRFRTQFGLEINFSCPNTGNLKTSESYYRDLVIEVRQVLRIFRDTLGALPLIPKINLLTPLEVAREIAAIPYCSALCVSNTVPWGALPDQIDWEGLFGSVSPLAEFGGGGLSGAPLTPLVQAWVREAMDLGFPAPLIASGGVMTPCDSRELLDLGVSAVQVGSVAIVRPWRVKRIIKRIKHWDKNHSLNQEKLKSGLISG